MHHNESPGHYHKNQWRRRNHQRQGPALPKVVPAGGVLGGGLARGLGGGFGGKAIPPRTAAVHGWQRGLKQVQYAIPLAGQQCERVHLFVKNPQHPQEPWYAQPILHRMQQNQF